MFVFQYFMVNFISIQCVQFQSEILLFLDVLKDQIRSDPMTELFNITIRSLKTWFSGWKCIQLKDDQVIQTSIRHLRCELRSRTTRKREDGVSRVLCIWSTLLVNVSFISLLVWCWSINLAGKRPNNTQWILIKSINISLVVLARMTGSEIFIAH